MAAGDILKKIAKAAMKGEDVSSLKREVAPYIQTSKSTPGSLFPDTPDIYTSADQFDLPRMQPREGGPVDERMQKLLGNRSVREGLDRAISSGIDLGMLHWYGTEPLRVAAMNAGLSGYDFQRMLAHLASASQRNPVDMQNKIGSMYWAADRKGLINPLQELKTNARVARGLASPDDFSIPEGYGSFAQMGIFDRAKKLAAGEPIVNVLDPTQKLGSFYENLRGNLKPVTVDVNASKYPAMLSNDPEWLAREIKIKKDGKEVKYRPHDEYQRGTLSLKDAKTKPGLWISAPDQSEYAGFEELWKRAANRFGIAPPQAQAAGWYGSGDVTSLKSAPELYIDNLEKLIRKRAEQTGLRPSAQRDAFLKGEDHLARGGRVGFAGGGLSNLKKLVRAFETYERVPFAKGDHLSEMHSLPDDQKWLYSHDPGSSWESPNGRDKIYSAFGLESDPTQYATGIYTPPKGATEFNPAFAVPFGVDDASAMPPKLKELMEKVTAFRAYMDAQGAGAGHMPVYGGDPTRAGALWVPHTDKLTGQQIGQIQRVAGPAGLPDIVDTGKGITLSDFYKGPPSADATAGNLENQLGWKLDRILRRQGGTQQSVRPELVGTDSVYQQMGELSDQFPGRQTTEMLSKLGRSGINTIDSSKELRDVVRAMHDRDAEWARKTGMHVSGNVQNARRQFVEGGLHRLSDIYLRGGLPALLGATIAVPALSPEESGQ